MEKEKKNLNKATKILIRAGKTSVLPLVVFVVCFVISLIMGNPLIGLNSWIADSTQILKLTFSTTLLAVALSINLFSGRFDFSLGSIMILSAIVSAKICTMLNLPFIMILVISTITGAIAGTLSGLAYVTFKLPPLVMSLIMTLIFEGLGFIISGGRWVSTNNHGYDAGGQLWILSIIFIVVIGILIVVFNMTKFSYNYRSLLNGQKVSVITGIKEKSNAVICYMISGALAGVCGFFSIMNSGGPTPTGNFLSVGTAFSAFLAVFVGAYLARWCEQNISYFLGGLSYAILTQFFSKSTISNIWVPVVSSGILLLFVIYLSNEQMLSSLFLVKGGFKKWINEIKDNRRLKKMLLKEEILEKQELKKISAIDYKNDGEIK
jgi:ribose transport system permease protein